MKMRKRHIWVVPVFLVLLAGAGHIVYGAETGNITSRSEKVYKTMEEGAGVIANLIAGTGFEILAEETDSSGKIWYRIRTGVGVEGYISAEHVRITGRETGEGNDTESTEAEDGSSKDVESAYQEEKIAGGGGASDGEIAVGGTLKTVETVNIREDASVAAPVAGKMAQGETAVCLGVKENGAGETWYEVEYGDVHGYVREGGVTVEIEDTEQPIAGTDDLPESDRREESGTAPDRQDDIRQDDISDNEGAEDGVPADGPKQEENGRETAMNDFSKGAPEMAVPEESADSGEEEETERRKETGMESAQSAAAAPSRRGIRPDRVSAAAFLGSFVCMTVLICLYRQTAGIYREVCPGKKGKKDAGEAGRERVRRQKRRKGSKSGKA